jgi:hypothetical protein
MTSGAVINASPWAFCCRAATGALDGLQHDARGDVSLALSSPIFILSHGDWSFGVEHSASFEEKIAQDDSGTGPNPVKLNANARMNSRRIFVQYSSVRCLCHVFMHDRQ